MGNIRRCRGIRRGAYARLVGIQTALHAEDQAGTAQTAEDGAEVEGVLKNHAEGLGNIADMREDNNQRHQYIGNTHHGHHLFGQLHNARAAAHDAEADRDS